jgi:hypothetical protein
VSGVLHTPHCSQAVFNGTFPAMVLLFYMVLTVLPLAGVAWIVLNGSPLTMDGLFLSLILLAMSGIVGTTTLYELLKRKKSGDNPTPGSASGLPRTQVDALSQKGRVQSVQFYEAQVGVSNKSIVVLSDGETASQTLVFEGDMRNALPLGQRVHVSFRKEPGHNVLLDVSYS